MLFCVHFVLRDLFERYCHLPEIFRDCRFASWVLHRAPAQVLPWMKLLVLKKKETKAIYWSEPEELQHKPDCANATFRSVLNLQPNLSIAVSGSRHTYCKFSLRRLGRHSWSWSLPRCLQIASLVTTTIPKNCFFGLRVPAKTSFSRYLEYRVEICPRNCEHLQSTEFLRYM